MDPQVFGVVLSEIAAGESARNCLASVGVNPRVFWGYLSADEEAAKQYARARARGLDRIAEEIQDIADMVEPEAGATGKAKLQIDSRKWLLSKLAPKKYGDKMDVTHAGDPDRPLIARIEEVIIDSAD
jgi:hypothetical protein